MDNNQIIILAVDDDPINLKVLDKTLTSDLTRVVCKPGAQAGLEYLDDHEVDIVITDLMMPQMDGITFVERLRNRPRYRSVPVLLWTALDAKSSKKDFLERLAPIDILVKGDTVDASNRIRSYAALMRYVRELEGR